MAKLTVEERTVGYREAGSGPPVILLHCSSSHGGQWKPLMAMLAPEFRCLAPDLPGYGASAAPLDDGRPCSVHDLAVAGAMLDLAGAPAHLVGHSLGGTVAAAAALTWPQRVASLTMFEPVFFGLLETAADPRRWEYVELAHDMIVLAGFGRREAAARMFLDFWIGPGAWESADPALRDYVTATIDRVPAEWRAISRHAPGSPGIDAFRRLAMPVHLLCGGATRESARAIVEMLRDTIPSVEYQELAGAGHMAPVTDPAAVNPRMADFLRRHAG